MEKLEWNRQEPTTVSKVGRRVIITKTFKMPDGSINTFDTKDAEGWAGVAVIGLTPSNTVLAVNLFRPGPEKMMQEIPGGGVEEGEDLEEAARREFAEETGHKIGSIAYLGFCHYDAYTNGKRHYFLAQDCVPSGEGQKLDVEEYLTVEEITVPQLIANATEGRMTDPGAVLLAYPKLQQLL